VNRNAYVVSRHQSNSKLFMLHVKMCLGAYIIPGFHSLSPVSKFTLSTVFTKKGHLICYFKIISSTVITQIVFLCVTVFPLSEIHLPLKSPLQAFIFCSGFLSFSPSCRNSFHLPICSL